MNIGIDIDDTICYSTETFIAYAMKYCRESKRKIDFPLPRGLWLIKDTLNWSDDIEKLFFQTYYDHVLKTVEIKPLVKETLSQLKADGHKIFFVTARHHQSPHSQKITEKWLQKYQLPYDNLIFDCEDKAHGCHRHQIDVFIDDSPHNCLAVASKNIKTFVYDCEWNRNLTDDQVPRIYSWPHFYAEIIALAGAQSNNSK
jgi:uncharacterized HAD superfamily protein